MKARPAATRDKPTPPTVSASARRPPRNTMSPWAARISPTSSMAPLPRTGAIPTPRPTARRYLIFLKFHGTIRAPAACSPPSAAIRPAMELPDSATASSTRIWRRTLKPSAPAAEAPATASPERPPRVGFPTAPVREIPSLPGRPACPAFPTTACAISPMFPCSLPTAPPGDTMRSFASPIRTTAGRLAPEIPATGPDSAVLPSQPR